MSTTETPAVPATTDLAFTRTTPYGSQAEPTYSGALSFLRRRYSKDLAGVDVAVVGVPFDLATTNRPGTRLGPRAIRAASASLAWCSPYAWDFDPLERLNVVDWGDVYFDSGRPHEAPDAITAAYAGILSQGVVPLTLGGDHFVSFPVLRALHAVHGPMALVHFDAHSDTWRDADGRIDHGTMFFHAARLGYVDPARSIQLGMRTHNAETHGFHVLDARELHARGVDAAIAEYVLDMIGETRKHAELALGASTRGALALYRAAQAHAVTAGRDYVVPDDVKALAEPVLAHRLVTRSWAAGGHPDAGPVVREILSKLRVPS